MADYWFILIHLLSTRVSVVFPISHVKQYRLEPLDSADPLQTVADSAEPPPK